MAMWQGSHGRKSESDIAVGAQVRTTATTGGREDKTDHHETHVCRGPESRSYLIGAEVFSPGGRLAAMAHYRP